MTTIDPSLPGPHVTSRDVVFDSPWVRVVAKGVSFLPTPFYCVEVPDYVAVCARVPDGRIVLVRQYRPTIEKLVWEFCAGAVDPGETPAVSAARELEEETGYRVTRLVSLGSFCAETGRLSNRAHLYFCEAEAIEGWVQQEADVTAHLVAPEEVDRLIATGQFPTVQHVALWLQAKAAHLIPGPLATL